MSRWLPGFPPAQSTSETHRRRGWFPFRLAFYGAILAALFFFRVLPALRSPGDTPLFPTGDRQLEVSGVSLAPDLITRLLEEYRTDYPDIPIEARAGGTTQALEDLINREVDVAFLARPPSEAEATVIRDRGDSISTYPIALGGIALIAATGSRIESVDLEFLRGLFRGESDTRLYVPEPNRGLWSAALERAGLASAGAPPPGNVAWMEDEAQVVVAVSNDANALGLASTLALGDSLEARGIRFVPVRGAAGDAAFTANSHNVALGEYPLFHYLYVSCRPGSGALASGFVTYLFSGRGQRLVSRAGYLPAREVPHLIQLVSKPIGGKGT